ncbi:TetR/AcrR family transcriptional regulator [Youngiibacter fragilis]|uniref:AcrR family transcriptional regulator n=1 Tax=Youngiibacter fragilis 232.1 TaxID=994573 RepID=V7I6M2_9CLOT|nr:TetR/AcrR family transcriptional regulator [Youngiibacter fragilis]ETA80627.1 AcrR family transcriptional regulator [Youngiibacter fragilis 232.1]
MNNELKKGNQSERILQTAFECISSKGYANVSMRDIADEAGVALSQLTYHYKNKDGLLTEVIKMMIQEYLIEVEEHLRKGVTPKEKLSDLITYFQEVLEENPRLFKMFYDFTSMSLWSAQFSNLLRNLFENLVNLIEKYVLDDIPLKSNLRTYTPKSIARMLLGAMFGTAIQVILDPQEKKLPEALNAIELLLV